MKAVNILQKINDKEKCENIKIQIIFNKYTLQIGPKTFL